MTFENAAFAIDGASLNSSLVRRALYASTGRAQGVVQTGDLQVSQLATPGVGVLVAPGVGLLLNRYQGSPSETYAVSNPSTHTVQSVDMPASNPSAKSYIVAVVVGDPDFSQTGHPWMGGGDPPLGEEETFEYVRVTLIEVSSGATSLSGSYPALPLARIDVPANTTTITDSMIVDLRRLAQPRQTQHIYVSPGETWSNASPRRIPSGSTFGDWGAQEYAPSTAVPEWATRAIVVASINSVVLKDNSVNIDGNIRTQLGSVSGPNIVFNFEVDAGNGAERTDLEAAGEYDVTSIAGTTVDLRVEGFQDSPASPTNDQKLALQKGSQVIFDVRYFEE